MTLATTNSIWTISLQCPCVFKIVISPKIVCKMSIFQVLLFKTNLSLLNLYNSILQSFWWLMYIKMLPKFLLRMIIWLQPTFNFLYLKGFSRINRYITIDQLWWKKYKASYEDRLIYLFHYLSNLKFESNKEKGN